MTTQTKTIIDHRIPLEVGQTCFFVSTQNHYELDTLSHRK